MKKSATILLIAFCLVLYGIGTVTACDTCGCGKKAGAGGGC